MADLTVADLIAELQRMPQGKPVRVVMSSVYILSEIGDFTQHLAESDAMGATSVHNCGAYILIQGGDA